MGLLFEKMMMSHRDFVIAGLMQLRNQIQPESHLVTAVVTSYLGFLGCKQKPTKNGTKKEAICCLV